MRPSAHCSSSRRKPILLEAKRIKIAPSLGLSIHFLQTQAKLLITDQVLNAALAEPTIVYLPVIKNSQDANADLRTICR